MSLLSFVFFMYISCKSLVVMPKTLSLESFLSAPGPIFDMRSPAEFKHGRLPNSISLPLFDDKERALVGTAYKQQGRPEAINLGLDIIIPKIDFLLDKALKACSTPSSAAPQARVLCWRGGMRSGSMARLLECVGFQTAVLQGGYKTYRRWALKFLETWPLSAAPSFRVLGGLTGCGKTAILQELARLGEQVIDLEALACHRGSAFGGIGLAEQPSIEQFENMIAALCQTFDLTRPIWVEDESRLIGTCCLPNALYTLIQTAPVFYIERNLDERLTQLVEIYGNASSVELCAIAQRLHKRLGGQQTQQAISYLQNGCLREACRLLLDYYDRTYNDHLKRRHHIHRISAQNVSSLEYAQILQESTNS